MLAMPAVLADGPPVGEELRFVHKPEQAAVEQVQREQLVACGLDKEGVGQGNTLRQQRNAGVHRTHTQREPGHGDHHDARQMVIPSPPMGHNYIYSDTFVE